MILDIKINFPSYVFGHEFNNVSIEFIDIKSYTGINKGEIILSDIRKLLSSEELDKNKLLDILNNEELQYSFRIPLTTIIGLAEFIIEDKAYQSSNESAEIENSLIKIANHYIVC